VPFRGAENFLNDDAGYRGKNQQEVFEEENDRNDEQTDRRNGRISPHAGKTERTEKSERRRKSAR
jgi:hypothetical protein